MRKAAFILFLISGVTLLEARPLTIGRLRYSSGGDWYSNPSSLPNLLARFAQKTGARTARRESTVSLLDNSYKTVPVLYFTGHGGFKLNATEKKNLRWFLKNGGFLFADDNFGMHEEIMRELNSLLPGERLQKLPLSHPLFKYPYRMPSGVPKIHKHYGGPPVAYALFYHGRMVAFYGYNTDLGDGMEDIQVHNDGPEKHDLALKMGVNVLYHAIMPEKSQ